MSDFPAHQKNAAQLVWNTLLYDAVIDPHARREACDLVEEVPYIECDIYDALTKTKTSAPTETDISAVLILLAK